MVLFVNKKLELKYIIEGNFRIHELLQALIKDGFLIIDYNSLENVDEYFDTIDRELLKAGGSLRIRRNDDQYKAIFKMPEQKGRCYIDRLEIEKDISGNSLDVAIQSLDWKMNLGLICPYPVLSVTNERVVFLLKRRMELIEVSYDTVKYYNPNLQLEGRDTMVEVEGKKNIDDETLENIDLLLREKLGLKASVQTKYERGLMLTSCQEMTRKREK